MRRSAIRRVRALARTAARRSRPRSTGPAAETVELVKQRAGHRCERCLTMLIGDRGAAWHIHHRRPRRMGGSRDEVTNSPSNLLALCQDCHWAVESRRAEAHQAGWLLHAAEDPAASAVLLGRGSVWCYLTESGEYADDPPDVA
jgi:5-methylcytosine-specific restriction enzyme A